MRVLYATRSWSSHDQRFFDAWEYCGAQVATIAVDGRDPQSDLEANLAGFEGRVAQLVNRFQPDVVHAGPMTDVASAILPVWSGPLIAMSWGFDLMADINQNEVAREQARMVISRADKLIVDNDGPRRVALELGAEVSQIEQFPWGIDLEVFHPGRSEIRESLGIALDEIVVLCTRRHEEIYDVQTIVDAFIEAASTLPRLRLLLAGGGAQSARLKATVQRSGFEERVDFLGEVNQSALPAVYRAADLYVSASRVDGSSVSLLEAMASGISVCVSEIEGNRQWIDDDRGLSFPVGDVRRLASHLTAFVEAVSEEPNGAAAQRRGRALKYVTEHANWAVTRRILPGIAYAAIEKNTEDK